MPRYIIHRGTGTIIDADEAVIVTTPRNTEYDADAILASDGEPLPDDSLTVSFEPLAIRQHFEAVSEDGPDPLAGLTDDDLRGVGSEAMASDVMWEAFGESLREALAARSARSAIHLTATEVLAELRRTWDLPTLHQQRPDVTAWLAERIELDSDMIFNTVVIDRSTGAVLLTDQGDRRVAIEQWLTATIHPQPDH